MSLVSAIAAFGIWPAVPLTGYWLFRRFNPGIGAGSYPTIVGFSVMTAVGLAAWSVPLLLAAVVRSYRADVFGALGWLVVIFAAAVLLRHRHDYKFARLRLDAGDWALAACLILAAVLYLGFPTETVLGGRDEGVYATHAIYIAHHGRLDLPYPWRAEEGPTLSSAFVGFPGFYSTQPTMTAQFAHVFPVWLAQAFAGFGHHGLFRLNAVFALLALVVFYGVCRRVVAKPYAVAATLYLALNPSQIWMARITLSEILAQLFIWSGLLLLLQAFGHRNCVSARWAGVCLGFSALVRIDSLYLVPLLFLAHLVMKLVQEDGKAPSSSLWAAVYQTALPIFALAVGYYAAFTTPYFQDLSPRLLQIGIFTLLALLLLLVVTQRAAERVRPMITARATLVASGCLLLGVSAYAYWLRPALEPFQTVEQSNPFIVGARTHIEDSLVNLAQYLSFPVVWGAILGWLMMSWRLLRQRRDVGLIVVLVVIGGFAALYLWNMSIRPRHFWAIRRFVPVVIPGFVLFAAFAGGWISVKLRRRWSTAFQVLLVLFLAAFTVRADSLILELAENRGYYARLEELSTMLPSNEPVVVPWSPSSLVWYTPLYVAFDRRVVPIRFETNEGKAAIGAWVARQLERQQPAIMLYNGAMPFGDLMYTTMPAATLIRSSSEETTRPLPRMVVSERTEVSLYRITGQRTRQAYLDRNLVARADVGVQETGFHAREAWGGQPVRWTNGLATLVVPVDPQHPPRTLRVALRSTGPGGTRFRVVANDRVLFDGRVGRGVWEEALALRQVPLGDRLTIKLISDTHIPAQVSTKLRDGRTLGVLVSEMRLERKERLTWAR